LNIVFIALAPVFIILFYVYFRDKYEKEPIKILLKSILAGVFITIPVVYTERFLTNLFDFEKQISQATYTAFIVAAITEESFKYAVLILLIWKNRNFNEKFDGIVYAVFVSMGFAAVENIFYVMNYGLTVGWTRAITAVPAHAIFGIIMGYYFGLAKFKPKMRNYYLVLSLMVPIILHGIYDFILMSKVPILLAIFFPFLIFMFMLGFKRMKRLSNSSVFKPKKEKNQYYNSQL